MSNRVYFRIYKIERDNFDGRLHTRLSFRPLGATCLHLRDRQGRCYGDDLDGGVAGTITAPAGTTLVELVEGTTAIELPVGPTLEAHEAYHAARARDRAHSYGLGWSPHQPEEVE